MIRTTPVLNNLLIAAIAAMLFVPFLGQVHLFDWDEINFAESAREMLVTGDYFKVRINYEAFWEKPPFFFWLQVISMKLFGVNEFAARFPNAICGILTLVVIYNIGTKLFSERFGLFWCLVYAGSILPHLYFKSGIIDPWFNLFIFSGFYFLHGLSLRHTSKFITKSKEPMYKEAGLAGLMFGLAILTKGPVALLILLLCVPVFWFFNRGRLRLMVKEILIFALILIAVVFLWFGLETIKNGPWFLKKFIQYQIRLFKTEDAGHGGPFYYHFLVLLLGVFPASVLAFRAFKRQYTDSAEQQNFKLWMLILFAVVLILFSIVKTKIVHYSSLCYFPLTFLAAYTLDLIDRHRIRWKKLDSLPIVLIGVTLSLAFLVLPYLATHKELIIPHIKDPFAVANLEAKVSWPWYTYLPGFFVLTGLTLFIIQVRKGNMLTAVVSFCICMIMTMQSALLLIAPRIERYSQGAAIDFYKSIAGKDCYVEVAGFKSYAHYFYFKKPMPRSHLETDRYHTMHGKIDKVVFVVTKINRLEETLNEYPDLKEFRRKNGFVILYRMPA